MDMSIAIRKIEVRVDIGSNIFRDMKRIRTWQNVVGGPSYVPGTVCN